MPDPTPYSEDKTSPFCAEAREVHGVVLHLTDKQTQIARFRSDDAMLSGTPPGHWTAILNQVAAEKGWGLAEQIEALARIGIAMAEAFIVCWAMKYRYDTVRPVSHFQKLIDPAWQPILTTPPVPEYPSGHSVQSGAATSVLTALFGEDYAFRDDSPAPDGMPQRHFASFWAAANEAAISRLYGNHPHFRNRGGRERSALRGPQRSNNTAIATLFRTTIASIWRKSWETRSQAETVIVQYTSSLYNPPWRR